MAGADGKPDIRSHPEQFAVIIEKGETSYGASVPELPGCIAVGETTQEFGQLIYEAIRRHLELLREMGEPIPDPGKTRSSGK